VFVMIGCIYVPFLAPAHHCFISILYENGEYLFVQINTISLWELSQLVLSAYKQMHCDVLNDRGHNGSHVSKFKVSQPSTITTWPVYKAGMSRNNSWK